MLVGSVVGIRAKRVWSVFILALASHYLLDFLPHWDYLDKVALEGFNDLIKIGIDLLIGIIIVILLSLKYPRKKRELIFLGAGVSIFPDFLNFAYVNLNLESLKPLIGFHNTIHYWSGLSFWQGLPALILIILISFYALKRKWG